MGMIWTKEGPYKSVEYESEADLEAAILQVQHDLFGSNRIYLDVKRKIGGKGNKQNIPDGYLIDLSGPSPRLYVVENELAAHDPLRHIAVQILEFSLSFESEPFVVKKILLNALHAQPDAKAKCEQYATASKDFRNLDHLLENLVFEAPFAALVVIDQVPEKLEGILARKFQFGVEVLELSQYQNVKGERGYVFEPFLADVEAETETDVLDTLAIEPRRKPAVSEVDTVVVPAHDDGFEEVFIGENRWYAIRIHGSMRPQIKYIAVYRVAPTSAITHIAPVKSIEPWKDGNKFVVNFSEPAKAIGPIPMVKGGRVLTFQGMRYTTKNRLERAKNLDDLW
jgi:hypothetical protein